MNSFLFQRFSDVVGGMVLVAILFFMASDLLSQSSARGPAEVLQLFGIKANRSEPSSGTIGA